MQKKRCVSHGYHTKNEKPLHVRKIESLPQPIYIDMQIFKCIHIYTFTLIYMHIYIYMCTFIYLYVCTCIYFSFVSVVWP